MPDAHRFEHERKFATLEAKQDDLEGRLLAQGSAMGRCFEKTEATRVEQARLASEVDSMRKAQEKQRALYMWIATSVVMPLVIELVRYLMP